MIKPTFLNLPVPFNFYRLILNKDHLHFGLWPEDNATVSMEDAQENMFNHLLSFFPSPPADVLDVGCGLGFSSYYLSKKGYRVTAIAPSTELIDYAEHQYRDSEVDFKVLGFFDEDGVVFSQKRYDVIFFQESIQYLSPLNDVFKRAREVLKDKGTIILGDEVCYDKSIKSDTSVHLSSDFIIAFSENGFRITEHQKIGKKVFPTFDFIINRFTEGFDRIVSECNKPDGKEKLLFFLNGWKRQKEWYLNGQMGYEIFIAKKDSFFIRPYTQDDEEEILPMFNEVFFSVNRSLEHWYWKFRDNPYGSHKIATVFSEEGDLVAHYAGYPVLFYRSIDKPDTFTSYQIVDTMTRPQVRNIGLGKTGLLSRMAYYFYAKFCEEVPFIYGFNTGTIKKLGMRYLGYTYIDPVTYWVRDILKNSFNPLNLFTRLLSGFVVEEVQSVNDEWDDLFNRVCFSYKLLVKRDATYVSWRYVECPDKIHRIFSVRRKGRLIGWSVFTRKDDRLIWGDALFDNRFPESVSYLLQNLLKHYFLGVKTIEGWYPRHPEWWCRQLKELGFKIVSEPNNLTPGFFIFDDPSLLETLQHYFYYTMGDSDLF